MSKEYLLNLQKREKLSQKLTFLIIQNQDKITLYQILNKLYFILIPILLIHSITFLYLPLKIIHFFFIYPICLTTFIILLTLNIKKNKTKIKSLQEKNLYLNSKLNLNQAKMRNLIQNQPEVSSNLKLEDYEKELLEVKKHLLIIEYIIKYQKVLQKAQNSNNLYNYLSHNIFTQEYPTYAYNKTLEILNSKKLTKKK